MSEICVFVDSILSGEQLAELRVDPSDTCAVLRVAAETSVNNRLKLLKDDTVLEDKQSLAECGISDGNHVQAMVVGPLVVPMSLTMLDGGAVELKADGSVVSSGPVRAPEELQAELAGDVAEIIRTDYAIACLKQDGSVLAWGSASHGGNCGYLEGVKRLYATGFAFAALKNDSSVVAWGGSQGGQTPSDNCVGWLQVREQLQTGVQEIYSNRFAFAALKIDGSVIAWGYNDRGGNCSEVRKQLECGVQRISCTPFTFTAVKEDGSEVTWGNAEGEWILNMVMPLMGLRASAKHCWSRSGTT